MFFFRQVSWRVPKKPAGQLKGYKIMWRYAKTSRDREHVWMHSEEGPYATGKFISLVNVPEG